jgi:hypothetical protein
MATMTAPKTLNGYPVIRAEVHTNVVTVMMDAPGQYVVATWWPELGTAWMWGHYFRGPKDEFQAAMLAFNTIAIRNEKR